MKQRAVAAGQRAKRGTVYVLTSEKFIRSIMYGAAIPIVGRGVETAGLAYNYVSPWKLPLSPLVLVAMIATFSLMFWADENRDEWRALVAEKTGEDEAVEEAAQEDEGNNQADTEQPT